MVAEDLQPELKDRTAKIVEDIESATSTLSQTSRGINLGLAALYFAFVIGDKANSQFFIANRTLIAAGSLFGALGATLDMFQYLTANIYLRRQLSNCTELIKADVRVTSRAQFMPGHGDLLPRVRDGLFYLKIAMTALGSLVFLFLLAREWCKT